MSDPESVYHVTYGADAHPSGIKRSNIPPGWGACDQVAIVSILKQPGGVRDFKMGTLDGQTDAPMSVIEVFEAWVYMARAIAAHPDIEEGPRIVAQGVVDIVLRAVEIVDTKEGTPTEDN